ncbi:MAG: hypothetical protein WBC40_02010 [Halobacteriota archaeon]
MTELSGDSSEQREAEEWLVNALSKKLGLSLTKKRLDLPEGRWIELDAFYESPLVLCEVWAHIGPPKSAQKYKVMTDAFKLLFASTLVKGNGKRILLFADRDAAAHFQGNSWMAQCLKKHNIMAEIIELPPELKIKVQKAQRRQYR